jgi:hypothetical protein
MNDLFRMGPSLLGPAFLGLGSWGKPAETRRHNAIEKERNYIADCDPDVDPRCKKMISGSGRSFQAEATTRETPPTLNCNPEWDPGCPRQRPTATLVPYLPSSYLRGRSAMGGARGTERETPPSVNCNPAWDPACPRPLPNRTMAPYVPSSYLRGPEVVYSVPDVRPRPRDRSGRVY